MTVLSLEHSTARARQPPQRHVLHSRDLSSSQGCVKLEERCDACDTRFTPLVRSSAVSAPVPQHCAIRLCQAHTRHVPRRYLSAGEVSRVPTTWNSWSWPFDDVPS